MTNEEQARIKRARERIAQALKLIEPLDNKTAGVINIRRAIEELWSADEWLEDAT